MPTHGAVLPRKLELGLTRLPLPRLLFGRSISLLAINPTSRSLGLARLGLFGLVRSVGGVTVGLGFSFVVLLAGLSSA